MKTIKLLFFSLICSYSFAQNYEYKIVTSVESIVPMGVGRSRIIENNENKEFKTVQGTSEGRIKDETSRSENKIENFKETNLLNFYSLVGINFQNIASNDASLSAMLNAYAKEGWELAYTNSAVESDSGDGDGKGIFITRFIFKKLIK